MMKKTKKQTIKHVKRNLLQLKILNWGFYECMCIL